MPPSLYLDGFSVPTAALSQHSFFTFKIKPWPATPLLHTAVTFYLQWNLSPDNLPGQLCLLLSCTHTLQVFPYQALDTAPQVLPPGLLCLSPFLGPLPSEVSTPLPSSRHTFFDLLSGNCLQPVFTFLHMHQNSFTLVPPH